MPKRLSLKKNPVTAKNQKVITSFFKNSDANGSQKSTSPAKTHNVVLTTSEFYANKRKAISPLNTLSIIEELNISDSEKSPSKQIPKKSKTISNGINISECSLFNKENNETRTQISSEHLQVDIAQTINNAQSHEYLYDNSDVLDRNRTLVNNNTSNKNSLSQNVCDDNKKEKNITEVELPKQALQFNNVPEEFCEVSTNGSLNSEHKSNKLQNSPTKPCKTSKSLQTCGNEMIDIFEDEWEIDNFHEDIEDNLDLTVIQRCEIMSVVHIKNMQELKLKSDNLTATCLVEGIWLCLSLQKGDVVSILATRNSLGQFVINNTAGLIVFRPDYLLSSTSVVAGVFCQRKAVLQERWRGIDSANIAMTIGILIHELVQKALTAHIMSVEQLRCETRKIIKESTQMLFDAGLREDEAQSNMEMYIKPLSEFMHTYMADKDMQKQQKNWSGHINKVLDIEENLCCPKLGLKGKIDATLEVTVHEFNGKRREMVPLELKSGRASVSVEHRGQLVLYGMMLSLLRDENPTTSLQRGLLLYLKERIELREVSCGYPERRDLVMLRNQLVQYLTSPEGKNVDDSDVDDKFQNLPEPIHRESVCSKCPYLTICSLHLWHTDGPKVSDSHPLSKLRGEALGHLSPKHIEYFLHWVHLLKLEEKVHLTSSPLHALWTVSVEKRIKRGTCAGNLKLNLVEPSGHRYLHIFDRQDCSNELPSCNKPSGPQEGDFSIVGIENRPWLAAGVVMMASDKNIKILLERDLSVRQSSDTLYHIDAYESYAGTVQNLTNLGILIEDSERAHSLRRIIIDKEPPSFVEKMPRELHRLGAKLMRSLNIEQQRAVFKALAAKDYALLQGLPGTGKTQTISILIQMLVSLKQRVLVTAHTHSAVDTLLCRLPESIRVMRLGSSSRVASSLLHRCEEKLTASCENPEQLSKLYDSMEVVGVTCLGAAHAMMARTTFDVCIVDEATQVLQCTVLRPLFAAKRFVMVGDPEQLPPVVRRNAARQLGMEESLFHRLMSEEATSTLRLQYRMNQALVDLANKIAYNDRLKCANQAIAEATLNIDVQKISHLHSNTPWLFAACSPEHAAIFINLETNTLKEENKKTISNWEEACLVLAIIEAMIEGNVCATDIGVIAPYRDQVSLLRRTLAYVNVEASTVDQFQGKDKSVIIYSCTKKDEGQKDKKVKEEEILNDQRRLAVSVTRAKHKLIVVGNATALHRYETLRSLIVACHQITITEDIINHLLIKYKSLQHN
ncbi:DNA replication ATP-dependent helicase/nuclease DNA2 [Battus philenor]|uniref:DNA replication ATP-dependent helicase/nuclease DNA2 n=1 Tax=Battus philenor TaxID=42288 RepID=UPI0035CF3C1C